LWNRPQTRATIENVGKGRIHVSLDETLLSALRERADREQCNQSDVVAAALHRELSPELFDRAWAGHLTTVVDDGAGNGHVGVPHSGGSLPADAPATTGHRLGH
jgi:hypothetical protein